VLGLGFTMSPEEAQRLVERDPRNRDVLFPYINGEDLNSRPDCSASRWVINFRDWPLEQAEEYGDCIEIVRRLVKPERDRLMGRNATANDRARNWWHYGRRADALYEAIEGMSHVLAIALTSKVVMPARVPAGMVYSHATGVFAYEDDGHLALLLSAFHYWWAITYSSTLESRIRYTPSDVFETFPQPEIAAGMKSIGEVIDADRLPLMVERRLGLTAIYNQVHNPNTDDPYIARLRDIHIEIDEAVAEAYGWGDLRLEHGFHETAQGVRFTVSEAARREILRRLLELNHQRHTEEEARGLTRASGRRTGRGRRALAQMRLLES
jgi:hypothetical protein